MLIRRPSSSAAIMMMENAPSVVAAGFNSEFMVAPHEFSSLFATGSPLSSSPLKRGSENLLLGSSGSQCNDVPQTVRINLFDNNNADVKKAKYGESGNGETAAAATTANPSKVIHIRNIPNDATETEIIQLGIPFGTVTNVLVLKGKNQAFLEMAEEGAATAMVTYFATCTALLRGRAVFVQYSKHQQLKTDHSHSNSNASAQAALQVAQLLTGQTDVQGGPNSVLRVIIEHMLYPITLDAIHQIFSRYGTVEKIVTFTKNNSFQFLIQFPDVVSAQSAKLSLDGKCIYRSCCTLRIDFSRLQTLNVRYNNDKSRDYTNANLPSGETTVTVTTAAANAAAAADSLSEYLLSGTAANNGTATVAALQMVAASRTLSLNDSSGSVTSFFSGVNGISSQIRLPFPASPNGLNGSMQRTTQQLTVSASTSAVLLVNNICNQLVSPDALFTLFGVYGDVIRVKILYNKKDCALIQYAENQQAQLAQIYLDKLTLFGKEMRVMPSKYQVVQMPKDGQPDCGLTKDYVGSSLHRFKKPGSKNYQNIYAPSAALHLSNIPLSSSEEEVRALFEANGFRITEFNFFPKDHRMALIKFQSRDQAVAALVKMHNYKMENQCNIRLTFSKQSI